MKNTSTFNSMPISARFAIALFSILGLAAVVYAGVFENAIVPVHAALLLAAAVLGSTAKINLFKGTTLSFLTSVVLLAVIKEGLATALLVAIVGVTVQAILASKKVVFHQLAFNLGMISATVTATWFAHRGLAMATPLGSLSSELTATVLGSFVYFLGNSVSVSLIISLTKGVSMVDVWLKHFLNSAPSFVIAGLLSLGVLGVINTNNPGLAFGLLAAVSLAYFSSVKLVAAPAGRTA